MRMNNLDSARALVLSRCEAMGLTLAELSRAIGANPAYIQQYLRRGIPRVLPEHVREALAEVLQISPDALRIQGYARSGPAKVAPDQVAQTEAERRCLQLFRALPHDTQEQALSVLAALSR